MRGLLVSIFKKVPEFGRPHLVKEMSVLIFFLFFFFIILSSVLIHMSLFIQIAVDVLLDVSSRFNVLFPFVSFKQDIIFNVLDNMIIYMQQLLSSTE
mmetsp:Transcript_38382/g.36749  ORF Transcript_38382/g.36749 Transcript_38382/m.36749 type:complete len:97 (+) Transcript_38382:255-545(+)